MSGRGRPLRGGSGGGGGGRGGGGGGGTRVHAAEVAAVATAGESGWLRQSGPAGQNLRPDGTSAGSCGKKPDKEESGGV